VGDALPLLQIRDLNKLFGGLVAVTGLDLDVSEGEILGLIGPNGAGKSTVLNMIGGTILPTRGKIVFNGEDITKLPSYIRAQQGIARVFQQDILFANLTVIENLLVGLHLHLRMGFVGTFLKRYTPVGKEMELASQTLEFTGLAQHFDELAKNLPHGKQRLLGLAIALATQPKLLLLDEPVTGMNAEEMEAILTLVKVVRERRGITSIIVEHNLRAVMSVCDRIAVLNFGGKIAEGSPKEVVGNPAVIEAYLGTEEDAA